jgi:hypothetical protein
MSQRIVYDRCVDDPNCWQLEGKPEGPATHESFVSVTRTGHGVYFLAYALLLLIIIILVWLCDTGDISPLVSAAVTTVIAVIVALLMLAHWYLYVKGVIPECCYRAETC